MSEQVNFLVSRLRTLSPSQLQSRDLPEDVVRVVDALILLFEDSDQLGRNRVLASLTPDVSFIFFCYAGMTAVNAVRQHAPRLLEKGILALGLENLRFDARDTICALAQISHSAGVLCLSPESWYAAVIPILPQPFAEQLVEFLSRPPEMRELRRFGFVAQGSSSDFDYVPVVQREAAPTSSLFRRIFNLFK